MNDRIGVREANGLVEVAFIQGERLVLNVALTPDAARKLSADLADIAKECPPVARVMQ